MRDLELKFTADWAIVSIKNTCTFILLPRNPYLFQSPYFTIHVALDEFGGHQWEQYSHPKSVRVCWASKRWKVAPTDFTLWSTIRLACHAWVNFLVTPLRIKEIYHIVQREEEWYIGFDESQEHGHHFDSQPTLRVSLQDVGEKDRSSSTSHGWVSYWNSEGH